MRSITDTVTVQIKSFIVIPMVTFPDMACRSAATSNRDLSKVSFELIIAEFVTTPITEKTDTYSVIRNEII